MNKPKLISDCMSTSPPLLNCVDSSEARNVAKPGSILLSTIRYSHFGNPDFYDVDNV